jgi:hypothetical protein
VPATLIAPRFDVDVSDISFETEASPLHSPIREMEETIECKCKLAAFGRCPTQLAS